MEYFGDDPIPNVITHPFGVQPSYLSKVMAKEEEKVNIKDSKGLKSGNYSKKHIEGIVKAAKKVGVDPHVALSLALQESGIGTENLKLRRGKEKAKLAMVHDFTEGQQREVDDTSSKTGIGPEYLKLAIALRDKLKYAKQLGFKDEASQLQAYNGYGTITQKNFGGTSKAYGVDIGAGIDMKKNPLYGKRLLELKKDIAGNKDVKSVIDSVENEILIPQRQPLSKLRGVIAGIPQ